MANELEHDWETRRRRLRGTLSLRPPKPDAAANDNRPPEKPAA